MSSGSICVKTEVRNTKSKEASSNGKRYSDARKLPRGLNTSLRTSLFWNRKRGNRGVIRVWHHRTVSPTMSKPLTSARQVRCERSSHASAPAPDIEHSLVGFEPAERNEMRQELTPDLLESAAADRSDQPPGRSHLASTMEAHLDPAKDQKVEQVRGRVVRGSQGIFECLRNEFPDGPFQHARTLPVHLTTPAPEPPAFRSRCQEFWLSPGVLALPMIAFARRAFLALLAALALPAAALAPPPPAALRQVVEGLALPLAIVDP